MALFGDIKSNGGSWTNTILAWTRYFIWVEKFKGGLLSEEAFRLFMGMRLKTIQKVFAKKNQHEIIDPSWWILFAEFSLDQGWNAA